jgi:hypothetical protein
MNAVCIEGTEFVVTGRVLKFAQIPPEREDYVDVRDPEKVIARLKGMDPRPDMFCFWQRLPETEPRYPYYMERDNIAAIRVTSYKEWLNKTIHSSVRTKLRKAYKIGVVVDEVTFDEEFIQGISGIFNETPIRRGRRFPHFGKTHAAIRSEWSVDLDISAFIGAYFEDELIGFVKLTFTDRYAEMSGTISKLSHRDKAPMSALIGRAVEFCESKGIAYLTYGKFTYGRQGEDSLSDFKRHNGFQKIELPRYYVPLTLKGEIALKLGLFHELSHYVPPSLMERARAFRTKLLLRQEGKRTGQIPQLT